ncbi:retrotransposon protein, putative, ty1-copia subclass [Tanacetum coccineum]
MCLYIDAEEHELGDHNEPANYKAALLDPKSEKWLDAMNVEMQFMKDNEVWNLVDLPPDGKTVGSKWLFKKKTNMDGAVHTYKARLVAKGFTQTYGIDYEETFSPVANIRAIRILVAITAFYDYEIWQMDVKTVFLNGHLSEEVYMVQPEGFVNLKYPNRVCKLKRSIYGLKQASRQWNKRFDDEIKKFGFTQNHDEPCVYKKASGSNVTFLILYVDDILIMRNHILMLQDVKSYLGKCFVMKDLGEAAYILGIKIYRDRSRWLIGLCQSAYIEKILKRFHMENSRRGSIPMQDKPKLCKSKGASTPAEVQRMQRVPYSLAVGSIMYDVRCTRPDVAFAQNITSRFQQNPEAEYIVAYDALKEAVWIRKFISGLGIVPTIEEPIMMYCDNTRAITIANESGITKGARHYRAKVHYLREVIELGDVKIEKVHTNDNLADPFTKALPLAKHSEHTQNIGMLPASSLIKLDVRNPLHLHPNDYVALTVVSIKLKGTENYQVWSCVMLLALKGKNKTGFIDGSCQRSNSDEVLERQWDRINRSQTSASFSRPSSDNIPNDNGNRRTARGSTLVYENCGFNGHTIERCFKIIGYTADFGFEGRKNSRDWVKHTREHFPLSDHVSTKLGELAHFDLRGPYKVTSRDGFKLPTFVLNGKSPYDLVYNKPPSLTHLRSFGCLAYATILDSHDKFLVVVNHLYFFNTNTLDDLPDIPNDKERRNPNPKRHGTPHSHSSSPSAPSNENDRGPFQDADASASESERSADLKENKVNSEGDDLQDYPHEGINQVNDNV